MIAGFGQRHGDIVVPAGDPLFDVPMPAYIHTEALAGMLRHKARQRRRHQTVGQPGQRHDAQGAGAALLDLAHDARQIFEVGEDLFRLAVELLALGREHQTPLLALEQLQFQLVLQGGDQAAGRGLAQVHDRGRRDQRAMYHHRPEALQLFDIQAIIPITCRKRIYLSNVSNLHNHLY